MQFERNGKFIFELMDVVAGHEDAPDEIRVMLRANKDDIVHEITATGPDVVKSIFTCVKKIANGLLAGDYDFNVKDINACGQINISPSIRVGVALTKNGQELISYGTDVNVERAIAIAALEAINSVLAKIRNNAALSA